MGPTCKGPGYATPLDAMKGEKERLIYVTCPIPEGGSPRPDYLATVDVDPSSSTYSQVIHRLPVPNIGDELHHTGYNACSSCCHDGSKKRDRLIIPSLKSSRIYIADIGTDCRQPTMHTIIEPEEIISKTGNTHPHTTHCLADGNVMISTMGDKDHRQKGSFILLNGHSGKFEVMGTWENGPPAELGYDFWYQPRHNIMISTEYGSPHRWLENFQPEHVKDDYGRCLNFWDWTSRKIIQKIDLGQDGLIPLEIRFLHDPNATEGFVGCALSSTVFRFYRQQDNTWAAEKVISVPTKDVDGWMLPQMPGLVTDILISLDDRYLYFSNWLQGDIRQYDITDTKNPKFVGQVFISGALCNDGPVTVKNKDDKKEYTRTVVQGTPIQGGPQMLQLSLDGKRLYVTTSLLTPWDKQFYPDLAKKGGAMLQIDVDTDSGGLKLNQGFLVDFGKEPGGPSLAHEMRYNGTDCTADIWL